MTDEPIPEKHSLLFTIKNEQETQQTNEIAALQEQLTTEKDARKEERFLFIFAITILINFVIFNASENWGAPVTLLILELIFLGLVAGKMGWSQAQLLLNGVVAHVAKALTNKGE